MTVMKFNIFWHGLQVRCRYQVSSALNLVYALILQWNIQVVPAAVLARKRLDLTTASMLFFTLSVLLNMGMMIVAWLTTRIAAMRWWVLSSLLALLGLLSLAAYFSLGWKWLLLAQNLAYFLALALVSLGIRSLRNRHRRRYTDTIVIGVGVLITSYAVWIKDDFGLRVANASIIFSLLSAEIIRELWRYAGGRSPLLWFGILSWAAFSAINLVRAALVITGIGVHPEAPFTGFSYLITFILGGVCTSGGYVGLIMLLTQKLIDEKRDSLEKVRELADKYKDLSNHDALTGILNRRSFMDALETEIARAQAEDQQLSVIMADLDHFKKVNDTHGHAAGDAVLVSACREWRGLLRSPDIMGRVGGEEFAFILPRADAEQASEVAERLRAGIAGKNFSFGAIISASFGVAQARGGESADQVLDRADTAMYAAKQAGRNRVKQG